MVIAPVYRQWLNEGLEWWSMCMRQHLNYVLLPPANEVCKGYVFTHVCHSVHIGGGGIPACIAGGIPACLAAGLGGVVSQHALQVSSLTPRGKLRGLARGVFRPTSRGSPGPHPGGSPGPHPGAVYLSMHWGRRPPMATAAGSTHPTGMHSCWMQFYSGYRNRFLVIG